MEVPMPYQFEKQIISPQSVLSVRTTTSLQELPDRLGAIYGEIAQYLGQLGISPAGAPFVAYYHLDMENLEIEAGVPVSYETPDKGQIRYSEILGGEAVTCLYGGPYTEMEPAYNALNEWIAQHGYQPTGVVYEFYLNDPTQVPPEELQTRIVMPLMSNE
jgi:effector-binding domain-containing protein